MTLDEAVVATLQFSPWQRIFPPYVKDWRSIDGPYHICKLVPQNSVMMEIGVYQGQSTLFFALSGKFTKVIGVDPFDGAGDSGDNGQVFIEGVVKKHPGIVEHWKMKSQDAIPLLPDNYLDLVYIDAVHDYDNVKAELLLLKPKMKKNGIYSGHDYSPQFEGVKKAIHEVIGVPDMVYSDTSWMRLNS